MYKPKLLHFYLIILVFFRPIITSNFQMHSAKRFDPFFNISVHTKPRNLIFWRDEA